MKLIKLAAAALITVSSLTAQAGLLKLDTVDNTAITGQNAFQSSISLPSFNVGGNLLADFTGPVTIKFTFLGAEAAWKNKFVTSAGSFTVGSTAIGSSFIWSDTLSNGDALDFEFLVNSNAGNKVVNSANNGGNTTPSFATLLGGSFGLTPYDAILFFDDTGGYQDDDNHDDLVVGVQVLSVPESSTLALMMMGLFGLFAARRMKA